MTDGTEEAAEPRDAGRSERDGLLVGIGAAASAPGALYELAGELPTGASYVICLSHQEALDDTDVLAELSQAASLPVVLASSGPVKRDRIYLVPAAKAVTIERGHFQLADATGDVGERGRVDSLIVSIAKEGGEHAVGVILAGTQGDGTLAVATLKEYGGLTLVEAPLEDTTALAMQAGPASIADYLLSPKEIGAQIVEYAKGLEPSAVGGRREERKETGEQIARIVAVLGSRTGHDFHGYKQNTFRRRVQRRVQVTGSKRLEDYVEYLREEPNEAQALFNDLLIGVTSFFRDKPEFDLLERDVIPKLFEDKGADDHIRIWVLGCATGEEAYSIGILLREHMAKLDVVPHVQIFATDIDGRSLASARVGRFAETITADVSPERLARWFVKEGNTYCVVKELREMCIFSQHSLIKDAPFSRIDVISCRNLLIYLNSDLQNRLIPLFHFSLKPERFLFLGTSENVTRHTRLFTPVDRRHRIFRRLETANRALPDFPLSARATGVCPLVPVRATPAGGDVGRKAERIVERYAPAYVVLDDQYDVLHFSGRTGRFLEPVSGAASLNIFNLIHRDLRIDLRSLLHRALAEATSVSAHNLKMQTAAEALRVSLTVEPIPGPTGPPQSFVVVLQDGEVWKEVERDAGADYGFQRDEHVQKLESELRLSRERLQATIEELESTNEELKSSNEELETSKEQLQSVNEELQTVNGELGHRVSELGRTNSDLKNLLESTQIATVFLDNDLKVKNFTPALAEIFHLIDTDIGRPISHIASRLDYPDMLDDVRKVLRTLGSIEREVEEPDTGARYLARVLPYRSVDNFIAGAVLTFLDISAAAKAERALRESEQLFRDIAASVPLFLFIGKAVLDWSFINPRFGEFTGFEEGAALGEGWLAAVHPDDIQRLEAAWRESERARKALEVEFRVRGRQGRYRWFLCRTEPRIDAEGAVVQWYGSCTDVHERHVAEERLKLIMAELQHRVKNILTVVRSIFGRTVEASGTLDEASAHFEGRLDSLARTQSVLVRTPEGGVELTELIGEELLSYDGKGDGQVVVAGPPVRLRAAAAEAMGLLVHELTTNAAKHGALARPSGRLSVTWRIYDTGSGPRLAWEWQESGMPVLNTRPSRHGFGRELIQRGLPYQLGATTALEFLPGGVRCAIELPLTERVVFSSDTMISDPTGTTQEEYGGKQRRTSRSPSPASTDPRCGGCLLHRRRRAARTERCGRDGCGALLE